MFERRCSEDSYWKKKEIQRNSGLLEKGWMAESTLLISINCKIFTKFVVCRPCGPMDKASDYESGDSRFESWQGRAASFSHNLFFFFFVLFPSLKYSLFSIPNKGRKTRINPEIGRTSVIIPIFPTNQRNKLWIDRLTPSEMFPFFSFHWNFFPLTKIGPTLEKISFK